MGVLGTTDRIRPVMGVLVKPIQTIAYLRIWVLLYPGLVEVILGNR